MGSGKHTDTPTLLNTEDVRSGVRWIFDKQNDCQAITRWYHGISGLAGEDTSFKKYCDRVMDYTGDDNGVVTNKDLMICHGNIDSWLVAKSPVLDRHLPYVGQCTFGVGVGYSAARLMKYALRNVVKVGIGSVVVYHVSSSFLAAPSPVAQQQIDLTKQQIEAAVAKTETWASQFKNCGYTRHDAAKIFDATGLGIINTKLGPGGVPEGASLYASIMAGLWVGLRCL
eukprot:TRINITY_DN1488_c6_g1_i1.p1 TRINITY_DN1488_c6_g1~~TRINITY_DN1488_c6_g1_i1.p1  ORF type:complete len:227 (+),score=27.00 TRINITY_DN1488_c6_g1_i1:73-753(+)